MKTHNLYKDGSVDKFRNYPAAIFIALVVSCLFFMATVGFLGQFIFDIPTTKLRGSTESRFTQLFFHSLIHFFKDFSNGIQLKVIILGMMGVIFVGAMYILKKPLIKVKYPFISFYGNSPFPTKFKIPELKSISITSDSYSLTFVIKHIGLTETVDVKGVSYIEGTAEEFIKKYTHIEPS